MLTYDMTKRDCLPLYDYLYRCIREDILMGKIAPGERLPSKRSLAKHLSISIITVENAYAQLKLEGYIISREKRGYFAQRLERGERGVSQPCPHMEEEEFEYSFFADLRANRMRRGQFPFSTWAKLLREVLAAQDENLLKTVPYNGVYELRYALAEYLREYRGMEIFPSQIIIGSGTEHLYCRLISLLDRDFLWAVEDVGNQKITGIYNTYRAKWKYVCMDEDGIDVTDLKKSGCNVVHVSPAHHFPLGTVLPIKRRQELLAWAQEDDHYIIEDDYDSEFRYQGKSVATLYSMNPQDKIIYMNTFSKTLIPSLRISYMVLPYELMERYCKDLSFYSGTVPSMEQYALARFLSEGYFERHLNHMQNYYKGLRNQLISAIRKAPLGELAVIEETGAGTHFLLRLKTDRPDQEIVENAAKLDVDVASLSEYQAFPAGDTHTLIINYSGLYRERIEETVERLYRAVTEEFPDA